MEIETAIEKAARAYVLRRVAGRWTWALEFVDGTTVSGTAGSFAEAARAAEAAVRGEVAS
jgi:hypothetical protein